MLKVGVDCHVHTVFSNHAYCTIRDNVLEAAERGLEGIGIADHFGSFFTHLPPQEQVGELYTSLGHFLNRESLPRRWHGVRLYRSVEIDIADAKGALFGDDFLLPIATAAGDHRLSSVVLEGADYAIASVHHFLDEQPLTEAQGTELYCMALRHPKVFILGHIGRSGIPFHIDTVLNTAKEYGKMIEINDGTFRGNDRHRDICTQIAVRCAELEVMVAVNSDAHCSATVGSFDLALQLLDEIGFPQKLIANESVEKWSRVIGKAGAEENA